MRPVASAAWGARPAAPSSWWRRHGRFHALGASGIAVAMMCLWRASAAVMSDVCANSAQDVLYGWVGRTGEWLIIAAVMAAYALHVRRERASEEQPVTPRRLHRSLVSCRLRGESLRSRRRRRGHSRMVRRPLG